MKLFGETVAVGAEIRQMPGISGRVDVNGLDDLDQGVQRKPEKHLVTHGDDEVTEIFARRPQEELGLILWHRSAEPSMIWRTIPVSMRHRESKITKASVSPKASRAARAFQKLAAMGQRLMSVYPKERRHAEQRPGAFQQRYTVAVVTSGTDDLS